MQRQEGKGTRRRGTRRTGEPTSRGAVQRRRQPRPGSPPTQRRALLWGEEKKKAGGGKASPGEGGASTVLVRHWSIRVATAACRPMGAAGRAPGTRPADSSLSQAGKQTQALFRLQRELFLLSLSPLPLSPCNSSSPLVDACLSPPTSTPFRRSSLPTPKGENPIRGQKRRTLQTVGRAFKSHWVPITSGPWQT